MDAQCEKAVALYELTYGERKSTGQACLCVYLRKLNAQVNVEPTGKKGDPLFCE